ncbi:MAG: PLP-dependent transferase [Spirochaetaceae bacterium]|nr:MAG: PLP-dependent transferase [Spirochaetaceae bacterium]
MPERPEPKLHPETIAIHGSDRRGQEAGAPLVAPEVRSTVFRHNYEHTDTDFEYTRVDNPNRRDFERVLAQLEAGHSCAAFGSGMAASAAVFQALEPGNRVLIPEDLYHGTRSYLLQIAARWGLEIVTVDMRSEADVERACSRGISLVWIETPSNPMLHMTDITAISAIADRAARKNVLDCTVCVDNTWASPMNQRPLLAGADLVMHSATKYLGGHSDILAGAIVAREHAPIFPRIRQIQQLGGAVPSPGDCHMLVRSIKTLPYRMRGHNDNAMRVARFLQESSRVTAVHYPGLKTHPGHSIATEQMSGYGGMLSFDVTGGRDAALRVVAGSRLVQPATSLGGVESTWEHRRSVEGPTSNTPDSLIRMSVGLEHIDDLLEDIEEALRLG